MTSALLLHTRRFAHRATPRRAVPAFTLLEVIIAITILGLGILGLAALFAGSARQQVDSTRVSDAANFANRFESVVRARFGPVSVGAPLNSATLSAAQGQYETTSVPMTPGVWFPLASQQGGDNSLRDALVLNAAGSFQPLNSAYPVFFLVDGPREHVLYHNPANPRSPQYEPRYGGSAALGASGATFEQGATPSFFIDPDTNLPRINDLPHGRIHPGSLRLRFEIARREQQGTVWRVASRRIVRFSDAQFFGDANNENFPNGVGQFPNDNAPRTDDGALRVIFNRTLVPPAPNFPPTAFIEAFQPDGVTFLGADEWIERIVVESYAHRENLFASYSDRVQRRDDGTVLAIAALIQPGLDGSWRMAYIVYDAGGAGSDAVYVPPEPDTADNRVLRSLTNVNLNYDTALDRWYFVLNNADQRRFLTQGAFVLVGDSAAAGGATNIVRIQNVDRRAGQDRAYLDGAPRVGGRPIRAAGPGSAVPITVWTLSDSVLSLEDNTRWKLSPVLARVVTLR
ncbi:MAG: type II secretion system protein [Phycisphaerales bacterium]|nr:MAG: type II secretion system protein [Phycisphaerales bacterium]